MINVTVYARKGHPACEQAMADLQSLQAVVPHQVVLVDIDAEPALAKMYEHYVPVIEAGPYHLQTHITRQALQVMLMSARDRVAQMEHSGDEAYQARLERGHSITRGDRFTSWFTRHYMALFNLLILLYVGLPFLAPVLMKVGATLPARAIYTIYSPLCHQLGYRSWFLFGEQPFYARDLAGVSGERTFEQVTGISATDVVAARKFVGNEVLGYKVALCERDVAIYGSIFLFGLLFSLSGRRLKTLHWVLWIIIGFIPIGIDGFSQLPSLFTTALPAWLPIRESTPLLRTITGFLFGFTTAWFGYPYIEETVQDARRVLARKQAVVEQTGSASQPGQGAG